MFTSSSSPFPPESQPKQFLMLLMESYPQFSKKDKQHPYPLNIVTPSRQKNGTPLTLTRKIVTVWGETVRGCYILRRWKRWWGRWGGCWWGGGGRWGRGEGGRRGREGRGRLKKWGIIFWIIMRRRRGRRGRRGEKRGGMEEERRRRRRRRRKRGQRR